MNSSAARAKPMVQDTQEFHSSISQDVLLPDTGGEPGWPHPLSCPSYSFYYTRRLKPLGKASTHRQCYSRAKAYPAGEGMQSTEKFLWGGILKKAEGKDNIHQQNSPWETAYPQHPSFLLQSLSSYEERSFVVQGHGKNTLLQWP